MLPTPGFPVRRRGKLIGLRVPSPRLKRPPLSMFYLDSFAKHGRFCLIIRSGNGPGFSHAALEAEGISRPLGGRGVEALCAHHAPAQARPPRR